VRRCRHLDPRDLTTRNRIPITTVPRTLVDLTDVLTPHQLANVIHEAQFHNLYVPRAVEAAMARANGRTNLKVLERAIELNALGSAGEVDFHWPDHNLIVEVDGPGHNRPRTHREDAARDRALKDRGLEVARIRVGR
jgi:hypothetical protein